MIDDILFLKDLNDHERLLFQNEYLSVKKNPTTGVLLALFLGGIGGHHFYMGNVGPGALYVIFCWTFIPEIVSLIELFLMNDRVDRHNRAKAQEIFVKLKAIRAQAALISLTRSWQRGDISSGFVLVGSKRESANTAG